MTIIKTARDLAGWIASNRDSGLSVGFVPTMGALHEGHLSLIARSRAGNAQTVCSIFVNPTQFNNAEDFRNYPVTIERDIELLLGAGCDVLFLPPVAEIYPPGHIKKHYDLGPVETVLEGAHRPGHFQGVCEVVERLLDMVQPDRLYLGQKDFQQCMVIRRLLELSGKSGSIELVIAPTLRAEDGLALSSRNLRLSEEQRKLATGIYRNLDGIRRNFGSQDNRALEAGAKAALESDGFVVDYISIASRETLLPLERPEGPAVVLAAASLGAVRLIDNVVIGEA